MSKRYPRNGGNRPGARPTWIEADVTETTATCSLDLCQSPRYQSRDMCGSHYMKNWRYGDPYYVAPSRAVDHTGRQYGSLLVLRRQDASWLCRCECGRETLALAGDLNRGTKRTCGVDHWYKETVTYAGAHDRVHARYGPAKHQPCVGCGRQARDWSYDGLDPDEQTSTEGPYSVKPEHYQARCLPCHRTYDDHPFTRRCS